MSPNPYAQRADVISRWVSDRQRLLRNETETLLRNMILDYETRQARHWHRDYTSVEAFEASVTSNRDRWRDTIGVFESDGTDLNPQRELWYEDDHMAVWWLTIDLLGGLRGRGLLASPRNPLILGSPRGAVNLPDRPGQRRKGV